MASYFLDSCAIAKRYIVERGTADVRQLCANAIADDDDLFISQVARIEVVHVISAIARGSHRHRIQRLAARDRLLAEFQAHCEPFNGEYDAIELTQIVIEKAADLCKSSGIKSFDAVQLASALIVREFAQSAHESVPVFVSADNKLIGYARKQGFVVRNPEDFPDQNELTLPMSMSAAAPRALSPINEARWRRYAHAFGRWLTSR